MDKKTTVIFDLDGTLLNTLEDLADAVNHVLRIYGYPHHSYEKIKGFVGNGIENLICKSLRGGKSNSDFGRVLSSFKKRYGEHCNDKTKPYDGIMELLADLKEAGIKMALVSNKAQFAVTELNHIYFEDLIPVAIGEQEAEGIMKKPDPAMVNKALELLGSTVEESVYIGDSEVDIDTAKNAGMDLILCEWGFREKDYLMSIGGETFVQTPDQIKELIQ